MGNPGAAAGLGAAMGVANSAARAFSNPRLVNWMARQTKKPISALPASMNQLSQMAETDPDAKELLEQIESQRNDPNRL